MEALAFFKGNKNQYAFASNHFQETSNAIAFVKALYKAGAVSVDVTDIMDEEDRIEDEGGAYADTFIISMPKAKNKRLDILGLIMQERPDECDPVKRGRLDWNKVSEVRLWWD